MRGYRRSNMVAEYQGFSPEVALVVHTAAARIPELRESLAHNPTLLSPTWRQLWGPKRPDAKMAKLLVSRQLPRPDRDLVIRRETRATVLAEFVRYNRLDLEEQKTMAVGASPAVASALLACRWLDPGLRHDLALAAGDLALLEELALAPAGRFTDDEVAGLLVRFHEWGPTSQFRERSAALKLLFSRRPAVIDPVLARDWSEARSSGDVLRTAIAGAAHLTAAQASLIADAVLDADPLRNRSSAGFTVLALVANPSTPLEVVARVADGRKAAGLDPEIDHACRRRMGQPYVPGPFDQVTDPATLEWLVRRALPQSVPRLVEMVELVANPHLEPEARGRLLDAVDRHMPLELMHEYRQVLEPLMPRSRAWSDSEPVPVPTRAWACEPWLDAAAAALGADQTAWETLFGLFDEFEGSFDELVELAAAI